MKVFINSQCFFHHNLVKPNTLYLRVLHPRGPNKLTYTHNIIGSNETNMHNNKRGKTCLLDASSSIAQKNKKEPEIELKNQ